jgi:hypothetical protein
VRRWVWDADMPEALVADEMGLGKTFTLVAVAMVWKLVTGNIVIGLPLSILWGNTLEEWVNLAQNNIPRIIDDEREWYPLQRQNSVPHCYSDVQSTPLRRHSVLTSAYEPILVVLMPGVVETFTSVINMMTYGIDFKLVKLLHTENANLSHENLNPRIDKLENRWNIHYVWYNILTSKAKPSSNG